MKNHNSVGKHSSSPWKYVALIMVALFVPWALYLNTRTAFTSHTGEASPLIGTPGVQSVVVKPLVQQQVESHIQPTVINFPDMPVLGPVPTNGAKPLWGFEHKGSDAIFALASNYPKVELTFPVCVKIHFCCCRFTINVLSVLFVNMVTRMILCWQLHRLRK
jgi:hypothetical protein